MISRQETDGKPGISCLFDPLEVHDHHFARAAHGQALSLDEAGWSTVLGSMGSMSHPFF